MYKHTFHLLLSDDIITYLVASGKFLWTLDRMRMKKANNMLCYYENIFDLQDSLEGS